MALMTVTPGTRVLGGLSAPRTSAAEQFQAGLQANLTRQDTKQAMRAREQAMELAQSQEARAQATFEAQQAARAAAQAQRAAQQRAFAEYTRSLREAPTIPEARVRRPVDNSVRTALTPTVENPFPLASARATRLYGVPLNVKPDAPTAELATPTVGPRVELATPTVGPRVGATRRRNLVESSVVRGGAGVDGLEGGAGADDLSTEQPIRVNYNGYLFDVFPNSNRVLDYSGQEYPDVPGYAELRAALFQLAGDPASAAGDDGYDLGDAIDLDVMTNELVNSGQATPEQVAQYVAKVGWANASEQLRAAQGGLPPELQLIVAQGPAPAVGDVPVADAPTAGLTTPPYMRQPLAPAVGDVTTPSYTPQPAAQGPGLTIPASLVQGPFVPPGLPAAPAADVVPTVGALPTPLERAVQTLVAAGIPREQVQQYIDRGVDLNYLLAQLPTGAPPIPSSAAAEVERINLGSTTGTPLYEQLVGLLPPSSVPSAATLASPEPRPAPERTGQDPFITEQETETGPIAGLTPAGERDPVAATEAAVRAAPDQDASRYFIDNPNLVLDLQTQMARERQMLEARLRYAEATQNIALYEQTFESLNSRERVVNENMISGQIAIIAAQQDNFGPLQEFLSRARPNDNVQVIPYTDGTVSFFVNGREDGDPIPVADLLEGLAQTFNTEYRDALAAAAGVLAEREQFLFENALLEELRTRREISVAQAKALADIEASYGEVEFVSDLPSGDKLFQVNVPGRGYVQFRVVEAGEPLVNGLPAPAATIEVVPNDSLLR